MINGNSKKAIIFDKDGTLIEYNSLWPDATRKMVPLFRSKFAVQASISNDEILSRLGLNAGGVVDSSAIASGTTEEIAHVLEAVLTEVDAAVLPFVRNYFSHYTIRHQSEIHAIGDVRGLFNLLKEQGYTLGIVTSDDHESTVFTLKYLQLTHLVDFVSTGDRYAAKPAAESIHAFSAAFDVPTDRILFVGDSITDMEFAKACRKGIGVLSGVGIKTDLSRYTDAVYPTIHDVPYPLYLL